MLKKIEKSYYFLMKNLEILRCPICHEKFLLEPYALICKKNHTFNLNKKGYVNFLQTKADTEHYTKKMFEPRRRLIEAGMYLPLLNELRSRMVSGNLLDVGTGEGTFLQKIASDSSVKSVFGFDIAKDGIEMAINLEMTAFMSLSDLTNLPFDNQMFSTILNIFTPSNYSEFHRVLTENGVVLKVVPDQFYLQELREIYGLPVDYDNQAVITRFKQEFPDNQQKEIRYVFEIPENLRTDFLEMSPLEWSVSPEIKHSAKQNPPKKATIHLQLLIGKQQKRI